jgi:hypothetical protein
MGLFAKVLCFLNHGEFLESRKGVIFFMFWLCLPPLILGGRACQIKIYHQKHGVFLIFCEQLLLVRVSSADQVQKYIRHRLTKKRWLLSFQNSNKEGFKMAFTFCLVKKIKMPSFKKTFCLVLKKLKCLVLKI